MRISAIVPTLNDKVIGRAIDALLAQTTMPDEIVVVGRFADSLVTQYPQVKFVDTQQPVCAAKARNMGIEASSGDILLFTDSDCIPSERWVEGHLAGQFAGHMALGGGIDIDDENYWALSDNVSMFHEFSTSADVGTRFLLPTLNLSVRREIFDKIGGMDETFPGAAGEDTDWTIRMRQAGYSLQFDPALVIKHAPERIVWKDVARHWYNAGYNNIRVRHRYPEEYNMPAFTKTPFGLRLLSPLIGAYTTLQLFKQKIYWRYLHTLPVIYATKVIYCWAAAKSIEDGYGLS